MKYLPVSRRKPRRSNDASQSALLMIRAGFVAALEVEHALELRPDAGDVALDILAREQRTLLASAWDRRSCRCRRRRSRWGVAEALQPCESHHRQQRTDVQAVGGGIEADVRGHRSAASASRNPSVDSETMPRHVRSSYRSSLTSGPAIVRTILLISDCMPAEGRAVLPPGSLDRRNLLKGLVGVGLGIATGTAAHGFLYERHHLELTRMKFPVSGLPESLRGFRIGVLTDIHRSRAVPHAMVASAVQDDHARGAGPHPARRRLRQLRRSPLRATGGGRARAAVRAARRPRRAGQSRRRSRRCRRRWPRRDSRCCATRARG